MTGKGDYNLQIYAQILRDYPVFDELRCVIGNAFEYLHADDLQFDSSNLTFTINDEVLKDTPIQDLAIAGYDYDTGVLEVLDTTYSVSGSAISVGTVSGSAITTEAVSGSVITTDYENKIKMLSVEEIV